MSRRLPTPPRLITKSISSVCTEFMEGGKLELSPSYQRERCWTQSQNCGIIDSIMRCWLIPMFAFYTYHPGMDPEYEKGKRLECMDGQNRLYAIHAFRTGKPLLNKKGKEEAVYWTRPSDSAKLQWSDMSPEERDQFDNFDVSIQIIQAPMTVDERKEHFTCLQNGTSISRPEYLKNSSHPVSQYISRAGLRDKFKSIATGYMLARDSQWMDLFVDCLTLWIYRAEPEPFQYLERNQTTLRNVVGGKEVGSEGTCYHMPYDASDDSVVTPLFESLFQVLGKMRHTKLKYHKFHATLLFFHILGGNPLPSIIALRAWCSSTVNRITKDKKEEVHDAVIRDTLWAEFQMLGAYVEPIEPPKRRSPPKSIREATWLKTFGASGTGVCQCCEKSILMTKFHAAHIQAVVHGGRDVVDNLIPTCAGCNQECGDENMVAFCRRAYPHAPFLRILAE